MATFGERLRERRTELRWTLEELAALLKTDKQAHTYTPTVTLFLICIYIGVPRHNVSTPVVQKSLQLQMQLQMRLRNMTYTSYQHAQTKP